MRDDIIGNSIDDEDKQPWEHVDDTEPYGYTVKPDKIRPIPMSPNRKLKGHEWTDTERQWVYLALIETDGKGNEAIKLLEEWKKDNPEIAIPTGHAIHMLHCSRNNRDKFLSTVIDRHVKFRLTKMAQSTNDRVALEASKYLWDRESGKPTNKVEAQVGVLTYADIEARMKEQEQKYGSPVKEADVIEVNDATE